MATPLDYGTEPAPPGFPFGLILPGAAVAVSWCLGVLLADIGIGLAACVTVFCVLVAIYTSFVYSASPAKDSRRGWVPEIISLVRWRPARFAMLVVMQLAFMAFGMCAVFVVLVIAVKSGFKW